MDAIKLKYLQEKARDIRKLTINEISQLGLGHIGGSLSIADILVMLYYEVMQNLDADNPRKEGRDKLVLSKGHAGPALYAVLSSKGYFPEDWLLTLNRGGTNLPSHCDMNKTPGVDFTTGSLGQGGSAAAGIALAEKLKGSSATTYLIIGDGESQEGQVWEMAMFAAQYKLNNLIACMDFNKLQIDGSIEEVMELENIVDKWTSFGWHVQRVDGHDFAALEKAFAAAKAEQNRPSMIVCDTIKAKGFASAEGKQGSHHMVCTPEMAKQAIAELDAITY